MFDDECVYKLRSRPETLGKLLRKEKSRQNLPANPVESHSPLPSGFDWLDKITFSLSEFELIAIGGRPSMGKTSFAVNIVGHALFHQKKPIVYFTMESTASELISLLVASITGIDSRNLRLGKLSENEQKRFDELAESLEDKKLYVDDSCSLKVQDVYEKALRVKEENDDDLAMIVIDSIQLIHTKEPSWRTGPRLDRAVRALKRIARELGCPVVVLSQINRKVDMRANPRPRLCDFRDTGELEGAADLVLMLCRPGLYRSHQESEPLDFSDAEIEVLKNAKGFRGCIRLRFEARCARFSSLD